MRTILAVPCDIRESGLIVLATRLGEELGRQGIPTRIAITSSAVYTQGTLMGFTTSQHLSEWLLNTIADYDVLCWMGFYQNEEDIENQILDSILLREHFGKKVFFLWERTGTTEVIPDKMLRELWISRGIDGVIALNQQHFAELSGFGVSSRLIHLIPPGVDTRQRFRPIYSRSEKYHIRCELNWPVELVIVLSIGRFVKRKRTDFLLRVWLQDIWLQENARLMIIGSGFGHRDSVESEVYNLASKSSSIKVIPHRDEMDRSLYYRAADIFVSAGILEGEPSTLVEAAACGLPIVASNIPGHTGLVSSGQSGLLFERDDPHQLQVALHALIESELYRVKLGKKARELAVRERDITTTARKFIGAFSGG